MIILQGLKTMKTYLYKCSGCYKGCQTVLDDITLTIPTGCLFENGTPEWALKTTIEDKKYYKPNKGL